MAPANVTEERAGIACGRGLPHIQINNLLNHIVSEGEGKVGRWMNGGLEVKVAFHVRPLEPILNDSSLEIIRPLVEIGRR